MKILLDGVIKAQVVVIIIIIRGDTKIIKMSLTQKDPSLITVIEVEVVLGVEAEAVDRSQMIKKRSRSQIIKVTLTLLIFITLTHLDAIITIRLIPSNYVKINCLRNF